MFCVVFLYSVTLCGVPKALLYQYLGSNALALHDVDASAETFGCKALAADAVYRYGDSRRAEYASIADDDVGNAWRLGSGDSCKWIVFALHGCLLYKLEAPVIGSEPRTCKRRLAGEGGVGGHTDGEVVACHLDVEGIV